jgi:2-keto-4-pentenoate hydratase/2-oxohepta-3-ene-1,7-dioic acid hydratase in catechol pathway
VIRGLVLGVLAALIASVAALPAIAEPVTYARFVVDGETKVGEVRGDRVLEIKGGLFGAREISDRTHKLADVTLLAPVVPGKIFAVGLNYRSHAGMSGAGKPEIFYKSPTSVTGPGAPIPYPVDASSLHYEGEMVVVIGKAGKFIAEADALDHVFGVTAGNDVSERSWQGSDLQWWRAKGADGFGPIGPYVVRGLDPGKLMLETRLNGETVQREETSGMLHDTAAIISHISQHVTLSPGDVIFTGTPGSTRSMRPGDVVEVELQGVGVLTNTVKQERP